MRVSVNRDRCEAHAACVTRASTVFSLDDDDELVNALADADVPESMVRDVTAAVAACPVAALTLTP